MARRQLRQNKKKPLIVICSEGGKKSSEYYYFRNHTNRNLRIQFSTGNSTDPEGMLEDLLYSNPHTSIYKILDVIDEFNDLNE